MINWTMNTIFAKKNILIFKKLQISYLKKKTLTERKSHTQSNIGCWIVSNYNYSYNLTTMPTLQADIQVGKAVNPATSSRKSIGSKKRVSEKKKFKIRAANHHQRNRLTRGKMFKFNLCVCRQTKLDDKLYVFIDIHRYIVCFSLFHSHSSLSLARLIFLFLMAKKSAENAAKWPPTGPATVAFPKVPLPSLERRQRTSRATRSEGGELVGWPGGGNHSHP